MQQIAHFSRIALLLVFSFLTVTSCAQVPKERPAIGNEKFDKTIKRTISFSVPVVGVEEVKKMVDNGEDVTLLDARPMNEYQVSHIPNARCVGFQEFDLSSIQDIPKDEKIILYCSIGYRSEKVAEQLQQAGYTNVQNLYGSIFEWVNQGYEVVDEHNQPTDEVHTYNKQWGKWVEEGKAKKVY